MASWEVSPILVPLIAEVKSKNAGMTVFTIGDAAHQAEPSDHNPDQWNFVCAGDFMIGSAFTAADAEFLFDRITAMIRAGDKRCAYAIYNRRIVSSTVQPGVVRAYGGSDPHTNHDHVSVIHGSDPHPTTSWNIYSPENDMDEQTIASKIGVDFNNDASGIALGTRKQVTTAVAPILTAVQALATSTAAQAAADVSRDATTLAAVQAIQGTGGAVTEAQMAEIIAAINTAATNASQEAAQQANAKLTHVIGALSAAGESLATADDAA